jgi:hypothetical protein
MIMAAASRGYLSPHALLLRNHVCVIPCGGLSAEDSPYWTAPQLRPYAKYVISGMAADDLFGGFVFDGIRVRDRRYLHPSYAGFGEPADMTDWLMWADALFLPDLNLNALAQAAEGTVRDVWVSIPYPHPFQRAFGVVGNAALDFAREEDRFQAVQWWLEQFLARWTGNAQLHPKLALRGFLWQREAVDAGDEGLTRRVNELVRRKGYLSMWLPNYGSFGSLEWRNLGFNVVLLFSNYTGRTGYEVNWIEWAAQTAAKYQTGVQVVWGEGLTYSEHHHWDYWNYGLPEKCGYMNESYLVHRLPNRRLDRLAPGAFPDYSRLYTFVKGLYVRTAYPGMPY